MPSSAIESMILVSRFCLYSRMHVFVCSVTSLNSFGKFCFKKNTHKIVYPVNCIAFHPRFDSTFATGGCDGAVFIWDGGNKKKLTTIPSFATSISSIAFNHDGSEMAIASSYTHEEGDRAHPQDEIFTRQILDSECKPKPK